MMMSGSACNTAAFLAVKMSSKMYRTRNGITPLVPPNSTMQIIAPTKYGHRYGRK